jgi:hypothetical protein
MTVTDWLMGAQRDADARGLGALKPLLETLSRSTATLRRTAAERLPSAGEDAPRARS